MASTERPSPPELLAPAGDWEAMRAAVANGADAVYFGLSNFNARHRAANFAPDQLVEVMKYLHDHNVRGFLAFNTLIFSDELEQAVELVKTATDAGVDAVIVQDLGLARLIHEMAPTLPLHGSTQMTLTEPRGIEFVHRLGIGRIILARELSLAEIRCITAATQVPVEVFIHGALCVAYSGQCLTSESLGGRSANRGQCAQACRLPYDLVVDGEHRDLGDRSYLLSPQDLAAHDLMSDLLKAGVCAFKIEGRLKSAHYVAATTQTYRVALDAAIREERFQISPQQRQDLEQSFSRGFTHGFLDGPDHQSLVHARFPKSRGSRIGIVSTKGDASVIIAPESRGPNLEFRLKPGDGIVFDEGHPEQDEQGGRVLAVSPATTGRQQTEIELRFHPGDVNLSAIAIGAIVWKTDDPAIRRRLEHSWSRETVAHRVPLHARVCAAVGQPLRISMRDDAGHEAGANWDQPLQLAQKHPLGIELVREQLGRLGQTPFELAGVELFGREESEPPDPVMVPKSVLNDLRRKLVDELLQQRAAGTRCQIVEPGALDRLRERMRQHMVGQAPPYPPQLTILVRTIDQLRAVLDWSPTAGGRPSMIYCDFEDIRRYKEAVALAKATAMPVALATLRIVKPSEEGLLRQIADREPDAVLVRNLAAVSFYSQFEPKLPMIGDYSLNIANELTAGIFAEAGLVRMVPSYDLNWSQLVSMLRRFPPAMFEAVVHQHMPMFHMEHCVFAHTLSDGTDYRTCGRPCERHQVDLRDRVGQSHPLIPDVGCRNTLFNAAAQSAAEYIPRIKELGIRYCRVELLRESPREAQSLLDRYARILNGSEDPRRAFRQLRVLNQLGVTRGTLEHG